MARIRTIKPEFFTHDGLFEIEEQTRLPIRVSFAGLWCHADREGRFEWKPRQLKLGILPFDIIDFSEVMEHLRSGGFIVKYVVENRTYGFIPSFNRHQHISKSEANSRLPGPNGSNIVGSPDDNHTSVVASPDFNNTNPGNSPDQSAKEREREKEREKEKEKPSVDKSTVFPEKLSSDKFKFAWNEWLSFRKEKKKPVTPISQKKALEALEEIGEEAAIETINRSIRNGWQGLFPEKNGGNKQAPQGNFDAMEFLKNY